MIAPLGSFELLGDMAQHLIHSGFSLDQLLTLISGTTRDQLRRALADVQRRRPKLCGATWCVSQPAGSVGPLCAYCGHYLELATKLQRPDMLQRREP